MRTCIPLSSITCSCGLHRYMEVTCIYIYTYTYIHTYKLDNTHALVATMTSIQLLLCGNTCMYVCIYVCVHVHFHRQ